MVRSSDASPRTDHAPSPSSPKSEGGGASIYLRIKAFIAAVKEHFRRRRIVKALAYLSKYGQKELEFICREKAVEMGVELSVAGVHKILDQQGLQHCIKCPNRFGLRRVLGIGYVCTPCHANMEADKQKPEKVG
jgi:hypothetical protein